MQFTVCFAAVAVLHFAKLEARKRPYSECSLKCHALLSMPDKTPVEAYRAVRACGHNIGKLVPLANYLQDRAPYDYLAGQLIELPVHIRYSLEAYEAFYPALVERDQAEKITRPPLDAIPGCLKPEKCWTCSWRGSARSFQAKFQWTLGR